MRLETLCIMRHPTFLPGLDELPAARSLHRYVGSFPAAHCKMRCNQISFQERRSGFRAAAKCKINLDFRAVRFAVA
jgi:hypothetical protein